jgi:hypothetical protein
MSDSVTDPSESKSFTAKDAKKLQETPRLESRAAYHQEHQENQGMGLALGEGLLQVGQVEFGIEWEAIKQAGDLVAGC